MSEDGITGRGVNPGRVLGSLETDQLKSHTHDVWVRIDGFGGNSDGLGNNPSAITGDTAGTHVFRTYSGDGKQLISFTGGTETRPRNIALMPCIKY